MVVIWTPTKIDQGTFCPRQFYLLNLNTPKIKIPNTGALVVGSFIHNFINGSFYSFFNARGEPVYKTAESCANFASKKAFRDYVHEKLKDNIEWKDKREYYWRRADVRNIMLKVYDRYVKEGPPLFSELLIEKLVINGRYFRGQIDELRKGVNEKGQPIIRIVDLKTSHREPGYMKQKYDPQFTIYALGVACLCYQDRDFAKLFNISDNQAERLAGNPDFISDVIIPEYYFMREDKIIPFKRENLHYYDLCDMVDDLENKILSYVESGNIKPPERGRNCDYCLISKACDEITEINYGMVEINAMQGIQLDLFAVKPTPAQIGEFSVWVDMPWRQALERKNKRILNAKQKSFKHQLFPRKKKEKTEKSGIV